MTHFATPTTTERLWVIAYDVCCPKRLYQIAKLLERHGTRVQHSILNAGLPHGVMPNCARHYAAPSMPLMTISAAIPSPPLARPLLARKALAMDTTTLYSPLTTNVPSLRYLVCFDISCNRTRRKVGRVLLGYGHRVQKSVFECCLTPTEHKTLQRSIDRLCSCITPNIRWYRLRAMDAKRIDVLGIAVQTDWQDFYII